MIVSNNRESLRKSGRIDQGHWAYDEDSVLPTLDEKYPQLEQLTTLVDEHIDLQRCAGVKTVIKELFVDMAILESHPVDHSSTSLIQRWIIGSDQAFMDLCDERHPVALILLAHYAVMVNLRTNMWSFRRWPPIILRTVQET